MLAASFVRERDEEMAYHEEFYLSVTPPTGKCHFADVLHQFTTGSTSTLFFSCTERRSVALPQADLLHKSTTGSTSTFFFSRIERRTVALPQLQLHF